MEYCFWALVATFDPGDDFIGAEQRETPWGLAVRSSELGKLFWPGGLYVTEHDPPAYLFEFLPEDFRRKRWKAIDIGGDGLRDFESRVNSEGEAGSVTFRDHPLCVLLERLLRQQPHCALFMERDCDRIGVVLRQSMDELMESVRRAYTYTAEYPEKDGFCSIMQGCAPGQARPR